jgi:hypothetical protein
VYWLPDIPNFKGIDGIIGVGPNIYLIQITISKKHSSPLDALSENVVKCSRVEASRLGGTAAFLFVVDEAVRGKKLCLMEINSKRVKNNVIGYLDMTPHMVKTVRTSFIVIVKLSTDLVSGCETIQIP